MFTFFYCYLFLLTKIIYCNECFEYSCEKCESPEYGKCTKCRKGFYLLDGTCPCSDSTCTLCNSGLPGLHLCFLCKNGYYKSNSDCYCNIKDCQFCSSDTCLICKTGYFYNSTSNECEEQKDEDKLHCYDINCDACFSQEKGACEYCKAGYTLEKGECFELPKPDINGNCSDGFYLKNGFCDKKCGGVDCSKKYINFSNYNYFSCPINNCLVCIKDELKIWSECDNSQNCTTDGCLNCITDDECLICRQGYYLLYGQCIKCVEGCSICTNSDTCLYCLSGYELNSEKKCVLTNNYDFNLNTYNEYKNRLIEIYYPEEIISDTTNGISDIVSEKSECDKNCLKCYDNTEICKECKDSFILENNTCIMKCSDENCLECKLDEYEQCVKCKEGYIEERGNCIHNYKDENCPSCKLENSTEINDKNEKNISYSDIVSNAEANEKNEKNLRDSDIVSYEKISEKNMSYSDIASNAKINCSIIFIILFFL